MVLPEEVDWIVENATEVKVVDTKYGPTTKYTVTQFEDPPWVSINENGEVTTVMVPETVPALGGGAGSGAGVGDSGPGTGFFPEHPGGDGMKDY